MRLFIIFGNIFTIKCFSYIENYVDIKRLSYIFCDVSVLLAPGLQCFLNFKVDLNLRFSLKMTKVYNNHFPKDKVDLNLRKNLNI